jgi:Protein of unknown function (DUF3146)
VAKPQTTAHVNVTQYSWESGVISGEVTAANFTWRFRWQFRGENDALSVEPSLGRALIQDALLRFLRKCDYQLEVGGDYSFTVRANL